jgi:hypothetical protein
LTEGETDEMADCYKEMSCNYFSLGYLDKAKNFCMKCLEIKIKLFGNDHFNLGESYSNLGTIYFK